MATELEKPNALEAEREILAASLTASGSFPKEDVQKLAIGTLTSEHMVHPHYKKIYVAMTEAVQDGRGTVEWADVRGYIDNNSAARETLRDIVTNTQLPPVTERYCNKLIGTLGNAYRSRKLFKLANKVQTTALAGNSEDAFDRLAEGLFELTRDRFDHGAAPLADFLPEMLDDIRRRRDSEGGVVGYRTGLDPIDNVFKGIQRKNLYFLAARPGHGKSMVIGQVFYNLATRYPDMPILLATTEMSAHQYLSRIAASKIGLNYDRYTAGDFDDNTQKRLEAFVEDISKNTKIIVNQDGIQSTQSLRQDIIRFQPHVLLVDYAQEFYPSQPVNKEYADVTMFARELNAMKKQYNLGILSALQLSRKVEERDDKRPRGDDLRATGWLEQLADGIQGLYRPKEYAAQEIQYDEVTEYLDADGKRIDAEELHWICMKNRHGKKRNLTTYVADGSMLVRNER
jgi:replicative DNA helicase